MSFLKRKILFVFRKAKSYLAVFFNRFFKRNNSARFLDQRELDQKLVHSLSRAKIPSLKQLKYIKRFLKPGELWTIRFLLLVILVNAGILGVNFYKNNFQEVPAQGGEYTEGVVGSPQYINPLYSSVNDVDKDISSLIFSSLFKFDPDKGVSKDLVEKYSKSEDGKTYTFKIREDVKWHHGEKLTADDVVFTFNTIKDGDYDSPLRAEFTGVNIKKLDEYSFELHLDKKRPDLLSSLTFGVMPAELWRQITAQSVKLTQLNLEEPIGSGPYELKSLVKNSRRNIISYTLKPNNDYYAQPPYIEELTFKFFVSPEEAINSLNRNDIDGLGYLPPGKESDLVAKESLDIHKMDLPQVNSLFFNQEINPILEEKDVRKALNLGLNKDRIISEVFNSDGKRVYSIIPPYLDSYNSEVNRYKFSFDKAEKLLEETDWVKKEIPPEEVEEIKTLEQEIREAEQKEEEDEEEEENNEDEEIPELSEEQRVKSELGPGEWRIKATSSRDNEDLTFRDCLIVELTVSEDRKNMEIAEKVKKYWQDLGVRTKIREVPSREMTSQVINPGDFEVLLFAQVFNSRPDLSSFWHSSEAEQGLNITGYSNEEVDELLDEVRDLDWNTEERINKQQRIQEIIIQDIPLIPLYSSVYNYVHSNKIKGVDLDHVISPHNRFYGIKDWYIKTKKQLVW